MKLGEKTKTILLVEDESLILLSLKIVLEDLDYQVITATNGHEALQLYQQHQDKIDLVITDKAMPGMDGLELLAALRTQSHDLKMVLMTEYALDIANAPINSRKSLWCIAKPFNMSTIAELVKEALA